MKKQKDWLRYPTPDCPVCNGKGTHPVKIFSACGQPEFGGRTLMAPCFCVNKTGKRPTMDEIINFGHALMASAKKYEAVK